MARRLFSHRYTSYPGAIGEFYQLGLGVEVGGFSTFNYKIQPTIGVGQLQFQFAFATAKKSHDVWKCCKRLTKCWRDQSAFGNFTQRIARGRMKTDNGARLRSATSKRRAPS